jgi:hypothetical protein
MLRVRQSSLMPGSVKTMSGNSGTCMQREPKEVALRGTVHATAG